LEQQACTVTLLRLSCRQFTYIQCIQYRNSHFTFQSSILQYVGCSW